MNEPLGTTLGLATRDLLDTVVTFVQWVLGLITLISTIMLLLAGFVWLTAAG